MCHRPIGVNGTAVACWIFLDVIFGNHVRVTRLEGEAFDPSAVSGLQTLFLKRRINYLFFPRHDLVRSDTSFKKPENQENVNMFLTCVLIVE